jgi:anti-sigma B factor antagonist
VPVPFVCRWKQDGSGSARIHLEGELDLSNRDLLRRELEAAQLNANVVSVDLRGLTFIDCSAVSILFEASAAARELGNRLILIPGSGQVDRILTLIGASAWSDVVDAFSNDGRPRTAAGHPKQRKT